MKTHDNNDDNYTHGDSDDEEEEYDEDDEYYQSISSGWGAALKQAFDTLPSFKF